jgi:hypothetical protein
MNLFLKILPSPAIRPNTSDNFMMLQNKKLKIAGAVLAFIGLYFFMCHRNKLLF